MASLKKWELPEEGKSATQPDLIRWLRKKPAPSNWGLFNRRKESAGKGLNVSPDPLSGLDPSIVSKSRPAWERGLGLRWSFDNKKLKPEHIATYSLLPGPAPVGGTCPGSMLCIPLCYAVSGNFCWKGKLRTTIYNTMKVKAVYRAHGRKGLAKMLENDVRLIKENLGWSWFRPHDSGDFFAEGYLDAWIDVAKRVKGIKVYFYTKSLWWLEKKLPLPRNMKAFQSVGGTHPIDLTRPHAVIIAEKADSALKKVRRAWGSQYNWQGEKGAVVCSDSTKTTPGTGERHIFGAAANKVVLPFHGAKWQQAWLAGLAVLAFAIFILPALTGRRLLTQPVTGGALT
jgi:hypothetical protein